MKKLMILAAMLAAVVSANAQVKELRHEIGVTYGIGYSIIGDGIGVGLSSIITGYDLENDKRFGSLSLEYYYHLKPRFAIGLVGCFSTFSNDLVDKGTYQVDGTRKRTYVTVMPSIKYYWVNNEHFGFYSKLAAGVMFDTDTYKPSNNKINSGNKNSETSGYFGFQISPIGLEAGSKNVRGMVEFGFGEQGVAALAGLKFKF